ELCRVAIQDRMPVADVEFECGIASSRLNNSFSYTPSVANFEIDIGWPQGEVSKHDVSPVDLGHDLLGDLIVPGKQVHPRNSNVKFRPCRGSSYRSVIVD